MQVVERTKQQSEPRLFIDAEVVLVVRKGAISLPPPPVEQSSPLRRRGLNSVVRGSAVYSQSIIPAEGTRAHTCAPVRMRSAIRSSRSDHSTTGFPRGLRCVSDAAISAAAASAYPPILAAESRADGAGTTCVRRPAVYHREGNRPLVNSRGRAACRRSSTGRGYAVPHLQPRAR
jgi:hypothetical protein